MLGRFDVPLTQATTNSLAAQRAFRAGEQLHVTGRDLEARASYKLAVDLDPKFAMGYLQLGRIYSNTGESALSRSYYQKAFDLRERTTDREKLYIATSYYGYVTGEIDRAIGAYQLWQSLYPNDVVPVNNLAIEYITLGEGDKAVAEARKAVELEPQLPVPYATLAQALFMAGDYRTLAVLCNDKARSAGPTMVLPLTCHEFSIVENDTVRQAEIERASEGKPLEAYILNDTAEAEAYSGHLRHATQLFAKSVTSARNHDLPELAAMLELNAVSIWASLDDPTASQSLIEDALLHSPGGAQVFTGAALAYAVMHHSG
jgi:tetratricopeptide (TPR) repeat protein